MSRTLHLAREKVVNRAALYISALSPRRMVLLTEFLAHLTAALADRYTIERELAIFLRGKLQML